MMQDLINQIVLDLKNISTNLDINDFFIIHFYVCAYIRNKYLWNNNKLINKLKDYFKTDDVDEISFKLFSIAKYF